MKIALYKGKGGSLLNKIVNGAIRFWTRGPYSHAELVFSDGVWFSTDPAALVVRLNPAGYDEGYDFVDVFVTEEQERVVRAWAISQVGKGYDWVGIFLSQFLPLGVQEPNRWFCSEIVTAALQRIGIFAGVKPSSVHPNRLFNMASKL